MLINEVNDDVRGGTQATTVCLVLILDSRFWGNTYKGGGGKFEAFFNVLCILGVFLRGFGILAGDPQEDSWK